MDKQADPNNSQQNAFVQDWLIKWAEEHTVYGSHSWVTAAEKLIRSRPEWAKKWGITVEKEIKDAQLFEDIIEIIQGTYDYQDHQERDTKDVREWHARGEVYILTTAVPDGKGGLIIDQEVFDSKPTFELEPNMMLRVANINGGDSAPA